MLDINYGNNKALERLHEFAWSNEEYRNDIDNTDYQIIEKELKALEIIKNKGIHCGFVKMTENLSNYNANVPFREQLTQEEYDFLKEVLL